MKWSDYNRSVARRGEILLGFDVINNWDNELKEMNKNKVGGQPFHYPNTFLLLLLGYAKACFHLLHIDRPKKKKVLHKDTLNKGKVLSSIPDFTTINRRIKTN